MKKTFIKILHEQLESNKLDLKDYNTIVDSLKPFDGKPLTLKNLKKAIPENEFHVTITAGMYYAVTLRNSQLTHLLGYTNDGSSTINVSNMPRFDSWADNGARTRIGQIEAVLADEVKLNAMVKTFVSLSRTWDSFCSQLKAIKGSENDSFYNPCYYDFLRASNIPTNIVSDIIFNKLKL